MSLHISKVAAEAEAIRLAEAFLVSEGWSEVTRAKYESGCASPNLGEPGARERKTIIKYTVIFRRIGWDGGEAMIRVNIKTQEARWWP